MRRLSLILSDLYFPSEIGPEEAGRASSIPAAFDLPNLDWLLRFAHTTRIAQWRGWLATELGLPQLTGIPVASLAARAELGAQAAFSAWFATPVRLEARLDHVRLADRGLLRIAPAERAAWCAAFARSFGPDYTLHEGGERGFLLTGLAAPGVATVDPARLLDSDVAAALPRGAGAGDLRRLGAEIEMWLHSAPLNDARERERRPRISAFWLWGGGRAGDDHIPARDPKHRAGTVIYGADPYLAALARLATHDSPKVAPVQLSALEPTAEHGVVELTPMSGTTHEALAALDTRWFAPARAHLASGALETFDLIANDRWFRIGAHAGWRFWRRRRTWLQSLRHRLSSTA